jgi:hypothetical protein
VAEATAAKSVVGRLWDDSIFDMVVVVEDDKDDDGYSE